MRWTPHTEYMQHLRFNPGSNITYHQWLKLMLSRYIKYRNMERPASFLTDDEWFEDMRFRTNFIADFNHWLKGPSTHIHC